MRKEESGWPRKVKVGYGTNAATRGLHPRGLVDRIVWQESDLEKLDSKVHIVRLARRLGEKKRVRILDRARQLNFHIANPGKREAATVPAEEETTKPVEEKVEAAEETSKAAVLDEKEEPLEEESAVEEEEQLKEEDAE